MPGLSCYQRVNDILTNDAYCSQRIDNKNCILINGRAFPRAVVAVIEMVQANGDNPDTLHKGEILEVAFNLLKSKTPMPKTTYSNEKDPEAEIRKKLEEIEMEMSAHKQALHSLSEHHGKWTRALTAIIPESEPIRPRRVPADHPPEPDVKSATESFEDTIYRLLKESGSVTLEEVMKTVQITEKAAYGRLYRMSKKGFIRFERGLASAK